MTPIQSIAVPLQISTDGITWLTLVCLDGYTIPLTAPTTVTDTSCGPAVGLGFAKHGPTGTGVCEAAPTGTQVTLNQLTNWLLNQIIVKYRVETPTTGGSVGANYYLEGDAYVTSAEFINKIDDVIKFNFTLQGLGIPSVVAGVLE